MNLINQADDFRQSRSSTKVMLPAILSSLGNDSKDSNDMTLGEPRIEPTCQRIRSHYIFNVLHTVIICYTAIHCMTKRLLQNNIISCIIIIFTKYLMFSFLITMSQISEQNYMFVSYVIPYFFSYL